MQEKRKFDVACRVLGLGVVMSVTALWSSPSAIAQANYVDNIVAEHEATDTDGRESIDVASVRKLLADQVAAWNKGDLKAFMAGYWNSPDLSFYSGRDKTKGWQETYERYKKRYQAEGREMGVLTFSELVFDIISADTMLVRGRWKLKLSNGTADGLYTLVVKKKPEGWRIVHDHTSVGEPEKKQP